MIRLFLVEDHTVVRQGLRLILEDAADITVVGEAATAQEALRRLPAAQPDVVLLDIHLPDQSGLSVLQQVHRVVPKARVIVLTVSDRREDIRGALEAGARGYLLKNVSAETVVETVRQVMRGGVVLPPEVAAMVVEDLTRPSTPQGEPLTPREMVVLQHMVQGLSNKEIARALGVSENTVKTHVRHILAKLNARSRVEAVTYALQHGLVPPKEST